MLNIKVWFLDYGYNVPEDFIIYNILKSNFNVELNPQPDYVIYGSYSSDYLKYDCIRIHYQDEQESPDFDLHDYEIGFDYLFFDERYIRLPGYQLRELGKYSYQYNYQSMMEYGSIKLEDIKTRQFCSYLTSNEYQKSNRDSLVSLISGYKKVSSGGRINNNIGYIVKDKLEFLSKFKFNIAAENAIYDYYTTEKIYDAFLAGTIPIYLGNSKIGLEFNPKSYIDVNGYDNVQGLLNFIELIDNNDDLYLEIVNQPKILDESIITSIKELELFLLKIFTQPVLLAKRRPNSQRSYNKAKLLFVSKAIETTYSKFPSILKTFIRIMLNNKFK